MVRRFAASLSAFGAGLLIAGAAVAQTGDENEDSVDSVTINGGGQSAGRTAVNAAAGNNNQQANVAVIALGGTAIASGSITQVTDAPAATTQSSKSASISDDAFAGSTGMVAVNVTAGSNNQQANLAVLGIGIEGRVMTDALLSQSRASTSPIGGSGEANAPEIATSISPGAFAGSNGLVQVSLVGGERNSSANIFALTVAEGTNP